VDTRLLLILLAALGAMLTMATTARAQQQPQPLPDGTAVGICEQVNLGETTITANDVVRDKFGGGGEANADSWDQSGTRYVRLYGATDNDLRGVTFTATAGEGVTFRAGSLGAIQTGPDTPGTLDNQGYIVPATGFSGPVISADGKTVTLSVANMPAKSAFTFNVIVDAENPSADIVVMEKMQGTLVNCDAPPPVIPPPDVCERVLAGRTVIPAGPGDVVVRDKYGDRGETNADAWSSNADSWIENGVRYIRLYGATDDALSNVTFTSTATQGFTFKAGSVGDVITGSPRGMGQLYGNGYTAAVGTPGTPVISPDGKTVTLTIGSMPAKSAFAFTVIATPDGSGQPLVADELLRGAIDDCSVPPPPVIPPEGICEQIVTGRTIIPAGAGDVQVRDKYGDGGEINADSWTTGTARGIRLYGATDNHLNGVTLTFTAAQGFTFTGTNITVRLVGSEMCIRDSTVEATGIGTPTISADGKTITLTVANMPANSAVILSDITAVPDGTGQPLVIDEIMSGTLVNCTGTLPVSTVTGVCEPGNDIVTVGTGAGFTGVFNGWGAGTVTYTTQPGYVFWINGAPATTHTETVAEVDVSACPVTPPPPPTVTPEQPTPPTPAQPTPAQPTTAGTPAPAPAPAAAPVPVQIAGVALKPTTLRIRKVGPTTIRAGARVTYTVRVTNTGRVRANNVVVTDIIPNGMSFHRATLRASLLRGKIVMRIPTLAPGATRTIRVTFRLNRQAKGLRTNIVTARANNAKAVRAVTRARVVAVAGAIQVPRVTG